MREALHNASLIIVILSTAPPSPYWDITYNTTTNGLLVDLSGSPGSIDTNFIIISLNKTKERNDEDHHDGDDNEDKQGHFMFIVNYTETVAEASVLPPMSNFTTTVYLVDKSNEIYRSHVFLVQTDEGGR